MTGQSGSNPRWSTSDPEEQGALSSRRSFLRLLVSLSAGWFLEALPVGPLLAADTTSSLEREIEAYIKGLRRRRSILPEERTSWSVYDFTGHRKLVSINEDIPRQSASMVKPFLACAYFYKVDEEGSKFRYGTTESRQMVSMIQHSSNRAARYFFDRLCGKGGDARQVERILKRHAPGIFRETSIVERIPSDGRCYRNRASAADYSRYLYALWNDQLPHSSEMKRLLHLPNADRIYHGARKVTAGTAVYDKTGTTARLCADMGILVARGKDGRRYPYTLIGIIERPGRIRSYGPWIRARGDVIREVSNRVYGHLKKRHDLR